MSAKDLFLRLFTSTENLVLLVSHAYETNGLSMPMHRILKFASDREVSVSDIAHHSGVSRQNIQTMVNRMKTEQLLVLKENPADKRAPLLEITAAGKGLAAKMDGELAKIARRLVGNMDADEIESFLESLNGALGKEVEHAGRADDQGTSHLRRLRKRLEYTEEDQC